MFFKKQRNNNFDSYEEDIMNLASKEEELKTTYTDDFSSDKITENVEYEEISESNDLEIDDSIFDETNDFDTSPDDKSYENYNVDEIETYIEDEYELEENKIKKYKKIINILFIIIFLILTMITVDVISVARYDVGPFFAIPLKKYKDGGSKAYYGIGYKVIKYNQVQGRKDKEIGFWNLKYNIDPVELKDIDLAIEMYNNEIKTYKKYYKKFIRLTSILESIDKENNNIIVSYQDEGKKYTLEIKCSMASKKSTLNDFKEKEEITIIGTITNFDYKTKTSPNKLYVSNCFAEQ